MIREHGPRWAAPARKPDMTDSASASLDLSRIDPRAIERVSGPAWQLLREPFLRLSRILLDANPAAQSELTTIYVKYSVETSGGKTPYAVVWVKRSSELVVGLALPEDVDHPSLQPPPAGMKYPLLTRYFVVSQVGQLPKDLFDWARLAHDNVAAR